MHGHAGHLGDAIQVITGRGGQFVHLGHAHGGLGPAGNHFVNRFAAGNFIRAHGQDVNRFAVQLVAGAQPQLFQAIEHVELGDAQARQTIDLRAALEQSRVKPAAAARTAGGHAFFSAHGGHVVTGCARGFPVEFGGEWAAAHAGAIRLGDAQDVVQHARAHARSGSGVAGHAVAGGHKRVGAVVHVEQGALGAFEQQIGTGGMRVVQLARHVGHHGQQVLGVSHGFVVSAVKVHRRSAQNVDQNFVVQGQVLAQLGGETLGVFEVLHTQGTARHFVFVSGANAAAGGADLGGTGFFLGGFAAHVQSDVVGQDQRASFAHAQA